ncbi:methyltransferase [Candidatus Nomurabacteria bacterium]|nr:MAG: methyltransferase [Candidatus Nomurabacteria bacterium]
MNNMLIKVTFISGLKEVVLHEMSRYPKLKIYEEGDEEIYLDLSSDFKILTELKSIINIYVIKRSDEFNPYFISKHKSVLGEIIDIVLKGSTDKFKTFRLSCAGSDSKEVKEIKDFIIQTYKLTSENEADLDIFIGKANSSWEVGVRLTSRPLTLRDYRVENIKGGLNPTVAYAMNSFCELDSAHSYLNIFSGSATLLIEAGLINKNLRLVGFDSNGKSNALAVENIKKAGLIKLIQLKTADIFNKPDLGSFDVIASDLPFGMQISKDEDLKKLYQCFVEYSEEFLNSKGTLVVYTTEHKLLTSILDKSKFKIIKLFDLKVSTVVGAYIYPKIFVCKF